MIKAILTTIFVCIAISGCMGKSDREKMSEAKAISICKDKGGVASYIAPPSMFVLKASCKNGEVVDYANITGPDVVEIYNKLESEKSR